MPPASEGVINKAIDLILEDIAFRNPGFGGIASSDSLLSSEMGQSKLDTQANLISQTICAVVAQFHSRIAQVRKQRNNLSLIHRLPIEILTKIFYYATSEGCDDHCYYRRLARLSRVCTFWATIIDHAPTLWTSIHDHEYPHLVDEIIARSGDCPLLICAGGYGCRCNPPQGTEAFLRQLSPQVHRWGVAYFTVYNSQDAGYLTKHLTNASAPRLKELSVRTAGYNTCMDLFRGGAERLEELVLSGVFMPWTFTSLPHLRILRLSKLKSKAAVTTGGFVKLLLKCPNLTKLEIQDCEISESNTSDLPDHLELAHLRHLDFSRNTPPVSAYSILSRIHSPRFEHFHFRSRTFISLTDNALGNLSHFAPSLVNLVASARKLFFHLRRTAYDFGTYSGLPTGLRYWPFQLYRWHDGAEAPSALVEWVTAHFGDAMKDIKTHVEIHNLSLSQRDLAAIGTIPFVVSLDLDGSGDQTLPVLRLLSTRTLINGRQSWTFPRLAKLSIKGKSLNLDATLNMVESRYGHNLASEEVGLNAQLPTPFTELNIGTEDRTCVDPSMIDRISGIVGKDQLHWSVNRRGYGEEDSDS